jgi:integrase
VVIVAYLLLLAEARKSISTLERALAAIAAYHRLDGQLDPTNDEHVRVVMKGIRYKLGTAAQKKAPVRLAVLEAMIGALAGDSLMSRRDRALLLVGYAGAFRRSELVALDVADAQIGLMLTIRVRQSKTDQAKKGTSKFIPPIEGPLCPVQALRTWLKAAEIQSGPLFRPIDRWGHVRDGRLTDKTVARVVKNAATRAGFEESQFAGHSLRSGFITEAASAGELSRDIMAQSGHQSEAVMRGYIQDAGLGAMSAVRAAFGRK